MKNKTGIILLSVSLSLLALFSCNSTNESEEQVITVNESDITKVKIGVEGMTCVGCEVTLENEISQIEGVVSVKASHSNNEAIIEFDSTKTNTETIIKTIKESGYKPFDK